ncbi:MAG: hypothetical protein OEW12_09640 [Deltaproteobacteria bacterium]|nr:hypothetical protein [Deltaproteobacteria bacterium]
MKKSIGVGVSVAALWLLVFVSVAWADLDDVGREIQKGAKQVGGVLEKAGKNVSKGINEAGGKPKKKSAPKKKPATKK